MIRIMAPTGQLGYVPENEVEAAVAAGAKVFTADDMRALRERVFMEHLTFKDQHKKPERKRKGLIRKGSR